MNLDLYWIGRNGHPSHALGPITDTDLRNWLRYRAKTWQHKKIFWINAADLSFYGMEEYS